MAKKAKKAAHVLMTAAVLLQNAGPRVGRRTATAAWKAGARLLAARGWAPGASRRYMRLARRSAFDEARKPALGAVDDVRRARPTLVAGAGAARHSPRATARDRRRP